MVKRTDSTASWNILDYQRFGYNADNKPLYADVANAEGTTLTILDLTSNGFKLRNSLAGVNASGGTYIYMAFAENPFKNSLAR
jgi:hypothetical protein